MQRYYADEIDFETIKNFLEGELESINLEFEQNPKLSGKVDRDFNTSLDNKKDCITSLLVEINYLNEPMDNTHYIKQREIVRDCIILYIEALKVESDLQLNNAHDPYTNYGNVASQIRNRVFGAYKDEPAFEPAKKAAQRSQSETAPPTHSAKKPVRHTQSTPPMTTPAKQKKAQNDVPQQRMFELSKSSSTLFKSMKKTKQEPKLSDKPLFDKKNRRK